MLHWSLCEHESLWGSEESELLLPFSQQLEPLFARARQFSGSNWLDAQNVNFDTFCAHLGVGIDTLYASKAGGRHWVEQTPSNTWALPVIKKILPRARFVFIHRDGRQVVESMMAMWSWRFGRAARTWRDANHLALAFRENFPDRVLQVSYEALVQNPDIALQEVWRFLGLEACSSSTRFIRDSAPINPSPMHGSESSIDKLKPRHRHWSWLQRRHFGRVAGATMKTLGYDLE